MALYGVDIEKTKYECSHSYYDCDDSNQENLLCDKDDCLCDDCEIKNVYHDNH